MANSDVNHNKRFALWKVLNEMDSWELKFGLKTALSMTLIAILQFLPATQHFFRDWRGEWALVTVIHLITVYCLFFNLGCCSNRSNFWWQLHQRVL